VTLYNFQNLFHLHQSSPEKKYLQQRHNAASD